MYQFAWPWMALLFPLPYVIKRYYPPLKKDAAEYPTLRFPSIARLQQAFAASPQGSSKRDPIFSALLGLSWMFLCLSWMQPERVEQFKEMKSEGYDLMLAVDLSASMQALDFSTAAHRQSRLDVTKDVVAQFAAQRQGDRVGLVLFGQHAYLYVPFTLDTLAVGELLKGAVPGMAGNSTAIGDAIGVSVRALRDRPEGSRVLILLTDGDDNASSIPPLEAAKLAKQYGVRVYTIGIGSNGLVPMPTNYGGYAMAQVTMDEQLLKEIASLTGGRYFRASDPQTLASVYQTINELEKTQAEAKLFFIRDPLYRYPLGLAMGLLLLLTLYSCLPRRKSYALE